MKQAKRKKVRSTKQIASVPVKNTVPEEVSQLEEYWEAEIEALLNVKFLNIEHAIDALAESVVDRMQIPENEQDEARNFIKFYFENDPELLARLKKIFQ